MSHCRLFERLVKNAPAVIVLALFSLTSNAEQTDRYDYTDASLWSEVIKRFNKTETLAEKQAHFSTAYQLLNQKCDFAFSEQSESRQLLEEAEYWETNYGIELRGGLTSGDIDSGDVDEGGRTYLELSWDVLDNGYKEFEYRAADLKRRAALENLSTDLNNTAYEYRCRGYQIRNSFTALEAALSSNKLSLMESIYQI